MKILFLGTSAGWPLPRLGCHCQICTSTDPKDHRLRPSLLVNDQILIDVPPDIYHQLFKLANSKQQIAIKYILLTHTHPDHIMGLYDLTHFYNLAQKPTIVATEEILKETRSVFGYPLGGAFKTEIVKPLQKIELNDIQAWYIPVEHGAIEAFGVKLKDRKIIFYAPEFRKILPSQRRSIRGLDSLILDGSSLNRAGQTKGHETIEEGIKVGSDLRAKKVLFTNIGHKTLPHRQLANFVKKAGGNKFDIAYDGLEIEL